MSHEIRTPMTAIIGFADLLADPAQTPEDRSTSVTIIRRNGEHLLALINDILDISKIEAGKMTAECIECAPAQVCADVYSVMHVHAAGKGLDFRLECDHELPRVVSDPFRMRQVLMNLVGNALKFTEHGEVVLRAAAAPAAPGRTRLTFEIRDTGIGMSPEQLESLFRPFSQADNSMSRRFGGTGLGLLISQRLTAMLNGSIDVQSKPGGEI